MGKYVTKKCSNCNGYIAWSEPTSGTKFGSPFVNCKHCGAPQIDKEYKEYIMLNPIDYFRLFAGVIAVGMIVGILLDFIIFSGTELIFAWICGIGAIVLHYKKSFLKLKEESIKRLKNKEYINQLLEYKLITKKQYDKFNEKYNQ